MYLYWSFAQEFISQIIYIYKKTKKQDSKNARPLFISMWYYLSPLTYLEHTSYNLGTQNACLFANPFNEYVNNYCKMIKAFLFSLLCSMPSRLLAPIFNTMYNIKIYLICINKLHIVIYCFRDWEILHKYILTVFSNLFVQNLLIFKNWKANFFAICLTIFSRILFWHIKHP